MKRPDTERIRAAFIGRRAQSHNDPSADQTPEEIATYYLAAKVGDAAAIRQTQYGVLVFTITEIDGINEKRGRLYVKQGAPWGGAAYYRKNGKSCFAPTGQTRLVVPTTAVIAWATKSPRGSPLLD